MPQVKPGETERDYIARCIPVLIKEGKPQDQAIAVCYSMFDEHTKKMASLYLSRSGVAVNTACISKADGLAERGEVDHGDWDGDSIPKDAAHGSHFAGIDSSEPTENKGHWKYPIIGNDGKLSAKGLASAMGYAQTNHETALHSALMGIHAKMEKNPKLQKMSLAYISPADFKLAVTLGQGLPKEIAGQPCTYFKKDLIHDGLYTHPTKGFEVLVDKQRRSAWIKTFKAMSQNGVKVPINVDHSDSAADCVGYVEDLYSEGESLVALCQFIGKDSAELAAKNYVSVGIDPAYQDGENHFYGDAIVHVALTPVPVVPGQEPFKTIQTCASAAAARGIFTLSAAVPAPQTRRQNMADTLPEAGATDIPCSLAHHQSMCMSVPGYEQVAKDSRASHLLSHLGKMHMAVGKYVMPQHMSAAKSEQERLDLGIAAIEKLKADADALVESRKSLTDKDREIQELRAVSDKPLPPEAEDAYVTLAESGIQNLISTGRISPQAGDVLRGELRGKDGKINQLALKKSTSTKGKVGILLSIIDGLTAANPPVNIGQNTVDLPAPGASTETRTPEQIQAQADADARKAYKAA